MFASSDAALIARLRSENHTIKRSLTDPRLLDGIGNSYSDEILHAVRMSPLALASELTDVEYVRLITAMRYAENATNYCARCQTSGRGFGG